MEPVLMTDTTTVEFIVLKGGWLYQDDLHQDLHRSERQLIEKYMESWASAKTSPDPGIQPQFIRVASKWEGHLLQVHMNGTSLLDITGIYSQNGEKIEYSLEYPQRSSELPEKESGLVNSSQPWRKPDFSLPTNPTKV